MKKDGYKQTFDTFEEAFDTDAHRQRMQDINAMLPKAQSMKSSARATASKAVQRILGATYFDHVPINDIANSLKREGIVLLQEDGTEWSGFVGAGKSGSATIDIAPVESGVIDDLSGATLYRPYKNAMLVVAWHRMESGRLEVTGYIS